MDYAINISRLVRDHGARLHRAPFSQIDGICLRIAQVFHVVIDEKLDPTQSRFVIAHELAHQSDDTLWVVHPLAERRADRLARESIIPRDRLMRAIDDGFTEFSHLATIFGVSMAVMETRCRELGLTT